MKNITIDSMMNREFLSKPIMFEDYRNEPKEISLKELAENKKDTVFFTNLKGGIFISKDELLEICKRYDLKVVYWDYVRMLAKTEGIKVERSTPS